MQLAGRSRVDEWEFDTEAGAVAGVEISAFDGNAAAIFFDDLFGDPEADAGAGFFFRAEEGIEDARKVGRGNAGAVIFDVEIGIASLFTNEDGDAGLGYRSVNGVGGVGEKIGDDLAKFVRRDRDLNAGVVVLFDADIVGVEAMLQDGDDVIHDFRHIDVDDIGVGADETEGEARDVAEARELSFSHGEVGTRVSLQGLVAPGEIEKVRHGFEWIVDLMRHGRGETTHGGEFFGVEECGFRILAIGDVERDATPTIDATGHAEAANFEPVNGAVRPDAAMFGEEGVARVPQALE